MEIDQFLQSIGARQFGPKGKSTYRVPDTYRLDLEEKAGAAPTIGQGPEGTALVFQFTDGWVMIMARHGSDDCIRGAQAFAARSLVQGRGNAWIAHAGPVEVIEQPPSN